MTEFTIASSESSGTDWRRIMLVGLLVISGPAYRAILDKLWIIVADVTTVGQWAQLQTIAEFMVTPAFAGVGIGLTVMIAQRSRDQHPPLLLAALLLSLTCTLPLLILAIFNVEALSGWLGFDPSFSYRLVLAALSGWCSIVFGQLLGYWLGRQRYGYVLGLTVLICLPPVATLGWGVLHPAAQLLDRVLWANLITGLVGSIILLGNLGVWYYRTQGSKKLVITSVRSLLTYVPAGLSIGLLTPLSVLVVRSQLTQQLGWEAAGTATALWRASDWILSAAAGTIYYHYFPRLSKQVAAGQVWQPIFGVARAVLIPSGLALLFLWVFQDLVLTALYSKEILLPPLTTSMFWLGDLFRICSSILLYALYALKAGKLISFGEILSQPLLALLLCLGASQSLLLTGAAHLMTYIVYAGFNLVGVVVLVRQYTAFSNPD